MQLISGIDVFVNSSLNWSIVLTLRSWSRGKSIHYVSLQWPKSPHECLEHSLQGKFLGYDKCSPTWDELVTAQPQESRRCKDTWSQLPSWLSDIVGYSHIEPPAPCLGLAPPGPLRVLICQPYRSPPCTSALVALSYLAIATRLAYWLAFTVLNRNRR